MSRQTSDAQRKAVLAYQRRQDAIVLRPSRTDGAAIRAAAALLGKVCKRGFSVPASNRCSATASHLRKQPMRINRIHNTTPRRALRLVGVLWFMRLMR